MYLSRRMPVHSTLYRDGFHPKLAHDHFTGPWQVLTWSVGLLSFTVKVNGRQISPETATATDSTPFYPRSPEILHPFGEEFGQFVWSPDLRLVEDSVVAVPLYTIGEPTGGSRHRRNIIGVGVGVSRRVSG